MGPEPYGLAVRDGCWSRPILSYASRTRSDRSPAKQVRNLSVSCVLGVYISWLHTIRAS